MPRQLREVVFVDGVRTPFGKAKGQYAETRADDLVIKCITELMRRNPSLPPERVDEVALAATTQIGDQGLTLGRTAALLAGLLLGATVLGREDTDWTKQVTLRDPQGAVFTASQFTPPG